jgi:hypothetical protein
MEHNIEEQVSDATLFGWSRNLKRREVKFLHDYSLNGMGLQSETISVYLALTSLGTDHDFGCDNSSRYVIQLVLRGQISILGGHTIGHSEQISVYVHVLFRTVSEIEYTVQMSKTPCPHTSCKVRSCWRRNVRICIIVRKLYQLCHLNNKYRY